PRRSRPVRVPPHRPGRRRVPAARPRAREALLLRLLARRIDVPRAARRAQCLQPAELDLVRPVPGRRERGEPEFRRAPGQHRHSPHRQADGRLRLVSAAAVHASAPRRAVALAAAALAAVPAGSAFAQASPDDQAEAERFVADLMERMTLREKIGQLNLLTSSMDVTGPTLREGYRESVAAGDVGAIFNAYGADYTRSLQTLAVEETRLGIPLLFGYDVVHGFRTIFPIP